MNGPAPAERLIALFRQNDQDGSGKIRRDKLIRVMADVSKDLAPPITEEELRKALASKWKVEDSINYADFVHWLREAAESVQSRPELEHSGRHLVIHLDINKTVIMSDHLAGKTEESVVNEVLANTSWGIDVAGTWELMVTAPCVFRPAERHEGQELASYAEWLEKVMPGRESRKKRTKLMTMFTEEGQPGSKLAIHKDKMLAALRKPDGTYVQLIPPFFEMLASLKKNRRSFSLCFRTFGEDLPQVSTELNAFCEGKHPLFPGVYMDGSDGDPDYRWHPADATRSGTFHRDDSQDSLVLGTLDQPGEGKHRDAKDKSLRFYDAIPGVSRIITGRTAVREFFWDLLAKPGTYGFRDFFPYWKHMHNTSAGGKMFFFTPSRSTNRHELFFDDNIRYNDAHIVQPINVLQPNRKLWATALLRRHLCRVDPLQAIYDPMYFVKELAKLEEGYERHFVLCAKMVRIMKLFLILTRTWVQASKAAKLVRSKTRDVWYDCWAGLRIGDRGISTASTAEEDHDEDDTHMSHVHSLATQITDAQVTPCG
mmetsp:Transcript_140649/g.262407  ORF Transcript_140649/g.262407 Transcript_140649/m.262407 type:complete len:541 (+) Transcript_140649:214-1836(+)